jgi:hypothetical protein
MLNGMRRIVFLALPLALVLGACASDGGSPGGGDTSQSWDDRQPVIYSVVVAEVLDDLGTAPPVVYVVDSVCGEAGQVTPSKLECSSPIPQSGRDALSSQLERYATVKYVPTPQAAVEGGTVKDGGVLFWFGPLQERKNGEVRVGANYTSELSDERSGAVNLALDNQDGSWIVTGAAGLGGCPA